MAKSDWKWNIRAPKEDDLPFIYATWLNSFWLDACSNSGFRKTTFFQEYPKVIDLILDDPSTDVLIACSPEDAHTIFGYLISTAGTLHYAYTKEIFQKYGIAKSLYKYAQCNGIFTHQTGWARPIIRAHPELNFNPFLLYKKREMTHEASKAD